MSNGMKEGQLRPSFFILKMVLGCSLLFALIILLYWAGLFGPFLLDDLQSIQPAQMQNFSWQQLLAVSLQNDSGPLGRPISIASFALNNYFFGMLPFSYKAINLGLHCLCGLSIAIFVYLLMLMQPKHKQKALWIASLTAILWLIHPLHISTVLYPVQRMTQLCQLFTLIGLNFYLLGRMRLILAKPYAYAWMLASIGPFLLAVLSKETGVLFPWYLLCIEVFLLKFYSPSKLEQQWLKRFHYTSSILLLLGAVGYYYTHYAKFTLAFAEKQFTAFDRLLTETKIIVFYIKLILFPQLSQMGLYHDDFMISKGFDFEVIFSCLFLLACAIGIWFFKKRIPIISFGLAWFFISHTVESTVLPLELVFEHRNYLAMVGLLLIISNTAVWVIRKSSQPAKAIYLATGTLIIITLMSLTFFRSLNWSSNESFLKEASIYHPLSARVHIEIANWLLEQKEYDLAFKELDFAQSLQPSNAGISLHRLLIHCHAKSVPTALYDQALQLVKTSAITPYAISVLDMMVHNMLNHQCNAVNQEKIIQIIQVAYNNPFLIYKPLYKATLYHLEAGLQLLHNNVDQSRILLLHSFEIYPTRLDPLIQKAYLEMQYGMIQEAQQTVKLIHAHQTMRTPTDNIVKMESIMHKMKHQHELKE